MYGLCKFHFRRNNGGFCRNRNCKFLHPDLPDNEDNPFVCPHDREGCFDRRCYLFHFHSQTLWRTLKRRRSDINDDERPIRLTVRNDQYSSSSVTSENQRNENDGQSDVSLHIENINEAEVNLRAENKELKKVIEDQNAKLKFLETENFKLTEIEAERDEMDGVKMDFINALVELGFPYHSSLSGFIPAIEKLKKKETELTNIQPENINNREEMQHLNQKVEQQNLMIATKSKEIEEQNQKMNNMLDLTNQRHEKLQDQLRSSKEAFQNLEGEHKKLETEIKDLRERNIYLERFKTMHQDFMLPNVETGTSSLGGKDECHLHDDIIKEKHATNVQLTEHIFHLNSQLDALRKENEKIKENLRHTI